MAGANGHEARIVEAARASLARFDGWENAILGMTGTRDPSAYTSIGVRAEINDAALAVLFKEDPFAAKVVEGAATEAIAGGWDLSVPAGEPTETARIRDAYRLREEEIGLAAAMREGAWWGRLYGGGVTWIGAEDGRDPSLPIGDTIATCGWAHTFDRTEAQVWSYYQDPSAPRFGLPEVYRIAPANVPRVSLGFLGPIGGGREIVGGILVHESRLLIWPGQPTTRARRAERGGWDDSVLERAYDALRQAAEDASAKSATLSRISQAVWKIKGLYDMIAGKRHEILAERMGQLDASRSRARGVVLDLDEDLVIHQQSLSGLDDAIDKGTERVAGATDLPAFKLTGKAPDGSGAPGQTEGDHWIAHVERWREDVLRPNHEKAAALILRAKDGPTGGTEPADWSIKYRSLRKTTPIDLATLRKAEAERHAIYIDKGVYPPEAVALAVATATGTGEVALDPAEVSAALERRRALANQPPKDNAELGTVGARSSAALDVVGKVATGAVSRETGRQILLQFFRLNEADAEAMLGPAGFKPAPEPGKPGPAPGPENGSGAGAPQGLPGLNAGGAREPGEQRVEHGQGGSEGTA